MWSPFQLRGAMVAGSLALVVAISGCTDMNEPSADTPAPWYAGYVDVTLPSEYELDKPPNPAAGLAVLSFIVAHPDDPCTPSWGGYLSLDKAGTLGLDQRIAGLRANGGDVVISFGGQLEEELATVCPDLGALTEAYRSVVDRYGISTIDLDVEGNDLKDEESLRLRSEAVALLQQERGPQNPLQVWLTLPVSPNGLEEESVAAVAQMLDSGVDLAGVNIMTMNFSDSRDGGQSMLDASTAAADATHEQLRDIYAQVGQRLDGQELWRKIGLTPMIGQNDVESDVFDLAAAESLNEFALSRGVGRMSMWSLNRDTACDPDESDLGQTSPTCSGVEQEPGAFSRILGRGFSSSLL